MDGCGCGLWICPECRPENFDPDHPLNRVKKVTAELPDTGIGKRLGYAKDKEAIAAEKARRAALPLEERRALEEAEREAERALLFGRRGK